ncbi:ABC transporter ATP-binding protein [Clostridium sp. MB40-C1]|uniref:metal ABC transporter ATP-binding protein n=1 Tax=Clostridium sp. MB40-C1 TaxID=3070996 RepID=UPI0027E0A8B3|nr:ABC transporter ATP-binding protein [Clostridium sp. MB40-C1]WMJ80243.1 ABC transporter ATP-binding protein [Clostridium sp. MB40-C1]
MKDIIEINEVSVYYDKFCALNNVNLKVKEKEFLAILGPNGGGKSTLLKLILGFKEPKCGKIKVLNNKPKDARNNIGYVPQSSKFDKEFPINVEDVVLMGKLNNKVSPFFRFTNKDKEKAYGVMEKLDIYNLKDRQIGQLSGGQLQRVLIARALVLQPKILLLDEPTASLDAQAKIDIYNLLRDLNRNITIVLVTHDIEIISNYATNIVCINKELYYSGEIEKDTEISTNFFKCPTNFIEHMNAKQYSKTLYGGI